MSEREYLADERYWARLLLATHPSFLKGQAIAAACILVSVLIRSLLTTVMVGAPFITFFPAVLLATTFGGRAAGGTVIGAAIGLAWIRWLQTDAPNLASAGAATAMFLFFSLLIIAIIHAFRHLLTALKHAEEQADVVAREMRHRVGNIMQLVQAISQMTARSSSTLEDFLPRFEGRLQALSEAHRVSAGRQAMPNDLRTLLKTLFSAYDQERISLRGPRVSMSEQTAPRLALAFHELATNAAKYGALSGTQGLVDVNWTSNDDGLEIQWKERGGPAVSLPSRRGFGSRLIQTVLSPDGGSATITYDPTGVTCTLVVPGKRSIEAERLPVIAEKSVTQGA